MEQQDFIQKWISRFGSLWDNWEGNYPYEPHIPVIATVKYQNSEEYRILHPDKIRQPDTLAFDSITDNPHKRYFICHNSSTFEYRMYQGSHYSVNSVKCETISNLDAANYCNTINSTIKTDLTVMEVKGLFQIEYERLLRHQNDILMLQRMQDPSYDSRFNTRINYDEIYAFTWTGSVKISLFSMRNEFGETFALKDFVRNRSVSRNFHQTYKEVGYFPQASSFQNPFLIRK